MSPPSLQQGDDESLYASIQGLRDRVQEISCQMQTEEMKAREAISQMNGPSSMEAQKYRDDHQNNMESLGKQLRQQQDELRRRQKERAAK